MTTQLTPRKKKLDPADVAREVMGTIKKIEDAIKSSNSSISAIQDRGFFKNVTTSSRDDLIAISRSQSRINDLMLEMIQEIISLNVMSYAFLASVLDEFLEMSRRGWEDNEGRMQRLSDTGKEFANTASRIFVNIIEGSKSTHQAIELNKDQIATLRQRLAEKDETDALQSRQIRSLALQLEAKDKDLQSLGNSLKENSKIDERQSRELASLGTDLEDKARQIARLGAALNEKSLVDERQSRDLESISILLEDKAEQVNRLGLELATKVQLDERQSREIESIHIMLDGVSSDMKDLASRLAERARIDETQDRRAAALEAQLATLERQFAEKASPLHSFGRKVVAACLASGVLSAAAALGVSVLG